MLLCGGTYLTDLSKLFHKCIGSEGGNSHRCSVEETEVNAASPLRGKTVIFLGSSVTYGAGSKGKSFVDFLEKADGIIPVKEAVSGTTLVDNCSRSYISRMKNIDRSIRADAFVCQLSTNDASKDLPLGSISQGTSLSDFDTSTVAGAIEYIIVYAKQTFGCPVMFYTGTRYESEKYAQMVLLLADIARKYEIHVLDMWNNEQLNQSVYGDFDFYMADGIHPLRAGYRLLWLPEFENSLQKLLFGDAVSDDKE